MRLLWWCLFNLANFCVISSEVCRHAMCTFLISRLSVGVLSSVIGQLDGSCESHCDPFHHTVGFGSVVGSFPLEMRSAGLDWDGTYLHEADDVSSWMKATLLPTTTFHLFGGTCIYVNTMDESVHRLDTFIIMLRAPVAFLYTLDKNIGARSSNLGIVNSFNDAILDVEHRSSQDVLCFCVWSACRGRLHGLVHCCHKIHVFVCWQHWSRYPSGLFCVVTIYE